MASVQKIFIVYYEPTAQNLMAFRDYTDAVNWIVTMHNNNPDYCIDEVEVDMTAKQQVAEYQRAIDWYFNLSVESAKVDRLLREMIKAFGVPPSIALVQVYALMTAARKG